MFGLLERKTNVADAFARVGKQKPKERESIERNAWTDSSASSEIL